MAIGYTVVLPYSLPAKGGDEGKGLEEGREPSLPSRSVVSGHWWPVWHTFPSSFPTRTIVGAQGRSIKVTSAGAGCVSYSKQGVTCFCHAPSSSCLPLCPCPWPSRLFVCRTKLAAPSFLTDSLDDSRTSNQLILGKNSNDGSSHSATFSASFSTPLANPCLKPFNRGFP